MKNIIPYLLKNAQIIDEIFINLLNEIKPELSNFQLKILISFSEFISEKLAENNDIHNILLKIFDNSIQNMPKNCIKISKLIHQIFIKISIFSQEFTIK